MKISFQGFGQLKAAANQIRHAPAAAAAAGRDAANDVARTVITQASRDISRRYNLPASYVRDQFRLQLAETDQVAVVGARIRNVRLARFDSRQLTAAAPRAKGDKLRKIAKGRKQAGISVKVLRDGGRKNMPGAFFIPLMSGRNAGGNGLGVFIRTGSGQKDIRHLTGPSPHQAFKFWIAQKRPDLQAMLFKAWTTRFNRNRGRSK